ncbi:MAG: hypothetical protein Q9162_007921 [Coniocarpon cinnabarinum]
MSATSGTPTQGESDASAQRAPNRTGPISDGLHPYGAPGARLHVPIFRIIVEGIHTLEPLNFARDYISQGRRAWTTAGQALYLDQVGAVCFGPEPFVWYPPQNNANVSVVAAPLRDHLALLPPGVREQKLIESFRLSLEAQRHVAQL